ncbi:hypothetical protein GCM10009424_00070 [Sphingomonas ursincola]|uniref:CopC domain-containing protein n=1 Tax=Sphingomonas ursincola TaxID=56361 RepID=A0A7V8RGH8_9SPHN|nr:copper resistance protein CopC [Sphingomonas ursincola]MBA1375991.1 hypothetical protein [Sphingomonas ursincola]
MRRTFALAAALLAAFPLTGIGSVAHAQPAPELVFLFPVKDGMESEPVSQIQLTFSTEVTISHVDIEMQDGPKFVVFDVMENNGGGQTSMVSSYDLPVPVAAPGQHFINYVAEVNRTDGTMDTVSGYSSFVILE